jgi:transposase InsO family protein
MLILKTPFESLALNFAGPLASEQECDLIFVILDLFSGYTLLFSVSKNIDAQQTAQILLDKIFTIHGYPLSIVSDRDSQFTSHF